jgi:hypothetical protein
MIKEIIDLYAIGGAHKVLQNPRLKVWLSGQGPKVGLVAEK